MLAEPAAVELAAQEPVPVLARVSEVQEQARVLELAWAPDLPERAAQEALESAAQLVRAEQERAAPDRAAPRAGLRRAPSTPAGVMIPPGDRLAHV